MRKELLLMDTIYSCHGKIDQTKHNEPPSNEGIADINATIVLSHRPSSVVCPNAMFPSPSPPAPRCDEALKMSAVDVIVLRERCL